MPGSTDSPLPAPARPARKLPDSTPSAAPAVATDAPRTIPFSVLQQKRQAHARERFLAEFAKLSDAEQDAVLRQMHRVNTANAFAALPPARRAAIAAAIEAEVRQAQGVRP